MIHIEDDTPILPFNQTTEYSEEFIELYKKQPNWIVRWGIIVISAAFLLALTLSFVITYPDIVIADILITTNNPPQKLIARTSGKIENIFIENKANVESNTPIAVIENSANYEDVFVLKSILDTIDISKSRFPFHLMVSSQLGGIENDFNLFEKEYMTNDLNNSLKPFEIENAAQQRELAQINERINILQSQKEISESELVIQKTDLERYETIYKKGFISSQEIEKQRLLYLQAQKNYKNILNTISQLRSSLNQSEFTSQNITINEKKESVTLDRNLFQALYLLKKSVKEWELNFVMRSSIAGKVNYSQIWAKNQNVNLGDNVFTIIPKEESGLIGKAQAVSLNSGKIKVGQRVNIDLENYPEREFGYVKGIVRNIGLTPDRDGNVSVDVELTNGLTTTYKKNIRFQQEMQGSAEIVTEDLRLIERVMYQFKDIFKR